MNILNLFIAWKCSYLYACSGLKSRCGTDKTVGSSLGVVRRWSSIVKYFLLLTSADPHYNTGERVIRNRNYCLQAGV